MEKNYKIAASEEPCRVTGCNTYDYVARINGVNKARS